MKRALLCHVGGPSHGRVLWSALPAQINASSVLAQTAAAQNVKIDNDDIGGVVTGPKGPEAGVWVIAETRDLPTRFAKIVVTDDQGRYVVPDLPKAKYQVWVRGYGLVDSPRSTPRRVSTSISPRWRRPTTPRGKILSGDLLVLDAENPRTRTSSAARAISRRRHAAVDGSRRSRTKPASAAISSASSAPGPSRRRSETFKSGEDAWMRRVQSGQASPNMVNPLAGQFGGVPFKYFGDWTDRVAKGELPFAKPPRPAGIERNVVITTWDWGNEKHYLHDLISSDKRNPTVDANGPLYGSTEYATDHLPVLDPKTSKVTYITPPEGADVPYALGPGHAAIEKPLAASAYWGMEQVWDTKFDNHNDMIDSKGRVWMTGTNHAPGTPAFCSKGSDNPYAKVFPHRDQ